MNEIFGATENLYSRASSPVNDQRDSKLKPTKLIDTDSVQSFNFLGLVAVLLGFNAVYLFFQKFFQKENKLEASDMLGNSLQKNSTSTVDINIHSISSDGEIVPIQQDLTDSSVENDSSIHQRMPSSVDQSKSKGISSSHVAIKSYVFSFSSKEATFTLIDFHNEIVKILNQAIDSRSNQENETVNHCFNQVVEKGSVEEIIHKNRIFFSTQKSNFSAQVLIDTKDALHALNDAAETKIQQKLTAKTGEIINDFKKNKKNVEIKSMSREYLPIINHSTVRQMPLPQYTHKPTFYPPDLSKGIQKVRSSVAFQNDFEMLDDHERRKSHKKSDLVTIELRHHLEIFSPSLFKFWQEINQSLAENLSKR